MNSKLIKRVALLAGPLLAVGIVWALSTMGLSWEASFTAGVTLWCALWWVFEPVPIPATSLLPMALFPSAGVLTHAQVAQAYGHYLILLLLGGSILSTAMERNGAHKRVALTLIHWIGGDSNRRLVWGFMLASAILSMWISNTATTLMLLPVAIAVLQYSKNSELQLPLLLGICYAASIGGIGTPIGTPPNVLFMTIYSEYTGRSLSFLDWMRWGVPVVLVLLPIAAWWLTRRLQGSSHVQIPELGAWTVAERRVLLLFALTALAWMTRKAPFGGWSTWLDLPGANDASIALLASVLMFVIPDGKGERLLNWESANKIPWGMLLLFAGGIAIARAFVASGLSELVAEQLAAVSQWPVLLMMLAICLGITFLTEMTSNTATTSLMMPILAAVGVAAAIDPALLMLPAAISASCAFMLPVATAPNAIIFGTGRVPVREMARRGVGLNLLAAVAISLLCYGLLS